MPPLSPEAKARKLEYNRTRDAIPEVKERAREAARERRAKPGAKERAREAQLRWLAKPGTREKKLAHDHKWLAKPGTRERYRENHLRRKYGLETGEWDERFKAQGSRCAICRGTSPNWHTDHDHFSGKVRGILCQPCNIGLGGFRDSPDSMRAAADYIEAHSEV